MTAPRSSSRYSGPNIVPEINADLEILAELLVQTLQGRFEWMRDNDILGIFQEFAKNLRKSWTIASNRSTPAVWRTHGRFPAK